MADFELLLNFNGTDGSTDIVDDSGKHYTGTALLSDYVELDDSWSKWGGTSLFVDENGYIDVYFHDNLGDQWTAHGWFKWDSDSLWFFPFVFWGDCGLSPAYAPYFQVEINGSYLAVRLYDDEGSEITDDEQFSISAGEHHIALTRNGTTHKVYLDGVLLGTWVATVSNYYTVEIPVAYTGTFWADSIVVANEILFSGDSFDVPTSEPEREGMAVPFNIDGTLSTVINGIDFILSFMRFTLENDSYKSVSAAIPFTLGLAATIDTADYALVSGDALFEMTGSLYDGASISDCDVEFEFSAIATVTQTAQIDADVWFTFAATATVTKLADIVGDVLFEFSGTATSTQMTEVVGDVYFSFTGTATVSVIASLTADLYIDFLGDFYQAPTDIYLSTDVYFGFLAFARAQTLFDCLVLNISNQALSTFTNYGFNSFGRFNNLNFAAKADGVYLLSGDDDSGTNIAVEIDTYMIDTETGKFTKPRYAWLSFKSDGEIDLVVRDERASEDHTYRVTGIIDDTYGGYKVKIGKGIKSKYITVKVKNVNGSSLYLDKLRLFGDRVQKVR